MPVKFPSIDQLHVIISQLASTHIHSTCTLYMVNLTVMLILSSSQVSFDHNIYITTTAERLKLCVFSML